MEMHSTEVPLNGLSGTLLEPTVREDLCIALIISGSGPTDRDGNNPSLKNNSLKLLAEALAENGIASLRYDKRGVGRSDAVSMEELRFEHYVEDAKEWVKYLSTDNRFKDIVVVGHSEGALIGSICSRLPEVRKFVSLAGTGRAANLLLEDQLKQLSAYNKTTEFIIGKLTSGETVSEVPRELSSIFRPSVQPYLISWFKYSPAKELEKLKKPVLIVQGANDLQSSVEDAEYLASANGVAVKKIINGMNHILKYCVGDREENIITYGDPNLQLHSELVSVLVSFLNSKNA